ncbi:MAG: hypothetical protein LC800_01680 [Acidobacteria bacterium]|nr:hypothetical protein [Acidobacteriota bacterium]
MSTMRGEKGKEQKRSRIVVDIDELRRGDEEKRHAAEEGRRASRPARGRGLSRAGRRRLMFVAGGLGVVLAGLALVGYGWYRSYKSSPPYSLALLADASARGDGRTVDALLDVDGVTRSLVPQVKAKIAERAQGEGATPAPVRRYVEQNAAVLIPGARDSVRAAVVEQIKGGVAESVESYPFFLAAVGVRFAADEIREEGDVATVAFKQNERPVELMMQRSGDRGHWRVVSVRSDELATRISDNLARGLPALGQ